MEILQASFSPYVLDNMWKQFSYEEWRNLSVGDILLHKKN